MQIHEEQSESGIYEIPVRFFVRSDCQEAAQQILQNTLIDELGDVECEPLPLGHFASILATNDDDHQAVTAWQVDNT